MHRIVRDVRIALRGFRHASAFAATVVLILGIGIGMAVAMMTVFDSVLVQALPVVEEDLSSCHASSITEGWMWR